MKICPAIFEEIEMDYKGGTFFCCACRIENQTLGNIFEKDFEEIWNSKLAIKMREEALKGNYPYCNSKICKKLTETEKNFIDIKPNFKPDMDAYPTKIAFHLGEECNAKCIFCRDNIKVDSSENLAKLQKILFEKYIPMCKNLEILTVNDSGDAFSSRFSKEFIKQTALYYPQIRYNIMTNGICASKEIISELGISEQMKTLSISINATTEKTHKKIFRNNGYKELIKNLEYIKELRLENKIEHLLFNFVICEQNWKEMKDFVNFTKEYRAIALFWEVRDYSNNKLENKYDEMAIHSPKHKKHKEFKKYISSPIFEEGNVIFSPLLTELRKKAILEENNSMTNKIKRLFMRNV